MVVAPLAATTTGSETRLGRAGGTHDMQLRVAMDGLGLGGHALMVQAEQPLSQLVYW